MDTRRGFLKCVATAAALIVAPLKAMSGIANRKRSALRASTRNVTLYYSFLPGMQPIECKANTLFVDFEKDLLGVLFKNSEDVSGWQVDLKAVRHLKEATADGAFRAYSTKETFVELLSNEGTERVPDRIFLEMTKDDLRFIVLDTDGDFTRSSVFWIKKVLVDKLMALEY